MKEERAIKRKKRRIKFVIKLGVFLLLCGAAVFVIKAPFFDVSKFEVLGNNYYSDEEVLVMGNCKTGGNIFIGTDTGDIKARLEKDAYMVSVQVKRVLPDTIRIELKERKQTAAIVYGEKYVVVDGEAKHVPDRKRAGRGRAGVKHGLPQRSRLLFRLCRPKRGDAWCPNGPGTQIQRDLRRNGRRRSNHQQRQAQISVHVFHPS